MSLNTILATAPLTTTNYILKATGTTIGNSSIFDNGTNVGIGNTNTSYTLDVSGTGRFTSTLLVSGAATFSNSVSIGTTNSSVRLNVQASANFETATLGTATGTMGYLSANGQYGMYIGIGNSGNTWLQSQRNDGGTTAYNLLLNPQGGNVGIGTSSPTATLHTEINSSTWVSKIINTNTTTNNAGLLIKAGVNSGNEILLAQKANGTTVFLVDASGNVGIGTSSPSSLLHLSSSSNTAQTITSVGAGSYASISFFNTTTGYGYDIGFGGSTTIAPNSFYIYGGSSASVKLAITSGGVVQIANLAGSGSRTVTADASGNLSASSDSSLKQEDTLHKIEGLAEILQLQPRAYKWKSDIEIRGEEATTEIGFFANEVNSIIPSAAPKGNDNLYGFYDRAVIAALVKAVQEQDAKITELKAMIAAK